MSVESLKSNVAVTNSGKTSSISSDLGANEISDRFMRLLVAQLKNQDPLSPMDNMAMTGQLSQLSSLTELTKISDLLKESLTQSGGKSLASELASASTLVGKQVVANLENAKEVLTTNGQLQLQVDSSALKGSSFELNVYGSGGEKIKSIKFSADQKSLSIEGLPGSVSVSMNAFDANGKSLGAIDPTKALQKSFVVSSALLNSGAVYLKGENGQMISFDEVAQISAVPSSSTGSKT